MNFLDYSFVYRFVWKKRWQSLKGQLNLEISASDEFLRNAYVDFSIIAGFILHTNEFYNAIEAAGLIARLKGELAMNGKTYFGNEIVGLEIGNDFCRPKDNLGTDDGKEGPLNRNLATPEELQYIPTEEIFQLFEEWLAFLREVESYPPRFKT